MLGELDALADAALPDLKSVLVDETPARAALLHYSPIRVWSPTGTYGLQSP